MGRRVPGLVFLAMLGVAALAWAAPTSMDFLKISTLPRISALGEAAVAVTDATWADANPANLTYLEGSLITFSHTSWYEDISLEGLTFGTSSGKHAFDLSVVGLHTEPLDGYDAEDRPTGTFRFFNFLVGASYARALSPSLSLGVRGKTVYEKIDWDSATGFAVDFGAGYAPRRDLLGGRLSAGVALRNLGPKIAYFEEGFDLPLTWQAGVSYRPGWLPDMISALAAVDYRRIRGEDGGVLVGVELGFMDMAALRFGHRGAYEEATATFGIGMTIANTLIDYAYLDLGEDLGDTHRVSVAFKVGSVFPSPEESR